MARKRKPVKGSGQVHLSVMVDVETLKAIDAEAARLTSTDALKRITTRTDVVRHWLAEAAAKNRG